jgi:hypothetical protein
VNRQKILIEEFQKAKLVPFAWNGRDDCLGWAGNVAERILGFDVIADMRGRYTKESGAKRVMAFEGWKSLADVVMAYFPVEIPTSQAMVGDWAIVVNDTGTETIGVVAGDKIAAKTETGMWHVPRRRATRAFRVE